MIFENLTTKEMKKICEKHKSKEKTVYEGEYYRDKVYCVYECERCPLVKHYVNSSDSCSVGYPYTWTDNDMKREVY